MDIMKVKTDIRELCSRLDEKYYSDLDVKPTADSEFDAGRIKELTFRKLHSEDSKGVKETKMKMSRVSHKLLIAAALIVALTTTAFAAGGLDFFRTMFGDSIEQAQGDIQQVGISSSNKEFEMTAEQLISDGFNTKVIVSVKPLNKDGEKKLYREDSVLIFAEGGENAAGDLAASASERLRQFDTKDKVYFCTSYSKSTGYSGQPITLELRTMNPEGDPGTMDAAGKPGNAELTLTIDDPQSIDTRRIIAFEKPEGTEAAGSYPISLTVNTISAVLTLQAPSGSADTPADDVVLVMKDKSKETIFEADWSKDGVSGGGAIMSDDPAEMPLTGGYAYNRDLESGHIVQTANFSRILNTADVDYILVGGERFDF